MLLKYVIKKVNLWVKKNDPSNPVLTLEEKKYFINDISKDIN